MSRGPRLQVGLIDRHRPRRRRRELLLHEHHPFRSSACWRAPARRSTAPCMSPSKGSTPSMPTAITDLPMIRWRRPCMRGNPRRARSRTTAGRACARRADDHATSWATVTITAFLVGLKSRGGALGHAAADQRVSGRAADGDSARRHAARVCGRSPVPQKRRCLPCRCWWWWWAWQGCWWRLLTSLSERRREMAVLRSVGGAADARVRTDPGRGRLPDAGGHRARRCRPLSGPVRRAHLAGVTPGTVRRLGLAFGLEAGAAGTGGGSPAFSIGLIPAYRIYRYSLADGMTIRV